MKVAGHLVVEYVVDKGEGENWVPNKPRAHLSGMLVTLLESPVRYNTVDPLRVTKLAALLASGVNFV